jgi:hypothetical protein
MAPSKLGRKVFECSACKEIVQFLEVVGVTDALPWSKRYCVDERGNNPDEPIP